MLISMHEKSSEVPIKTRSTPASLSFKGQVTKHITVKWSITCPVFEHLWEFFTMAYPTAAIYMYCILFFEKLLLERGNTTVIGRLKIILCL